MGRQARHSARDTRVAVVAHAIVCITANSFLRPRASTFCNGQERYDAPPAVLLSSPAGGCSATLPEERQKGQTPCWRRTLPHPAHFGTTGWKRRCFPVLRMPFRDGVTLRLGTAMHSQSSSSVGSRAGTCCCCGSPLLVGCQHDAPAAWNTDGGNWCDEQLVVVCVVTALHTCNADERLAGGGSVTLCAQSRKSQSDADGGCG